MARFGTRWLLCAVMWVAMTQNAKGTPPKSSDFKKVLGFGVIHVNDTLTQVQSALSKARVPHEFKVLHKTGSPYITLQTLVDRPNPAGGTWEATVYFDAKDRLTEVLVKSPKFTSKKNAQVPLAKLRKRFGTPGPVQPEGTGSVHWDYAWRNTQTVLRISLVSSKMLDEWIIWQSWVPAVRPSTKPPKGPVIDGSRINPPPTIR